jgi:superoxide dismutase
MLLRRLNNARPLFTRQSLIRRSSLTSHASSSSNHQLGGRITHFDQYGTPILNFLALSSIPFLLLNISWEYLYLQEYKVEKEERLAKLHQAVEELRNEARQ